MTIHIVPHAPELTPLVEAFNRRLEKSGSQWGFYTNPLPDWIPPKEDAKAWREYHLAVEDGQAVRGAYALKPQMWWINGHLEWVTDYQGPFSEGEIDTRYSTLALRLMRDMLKRRPLLYSVGHGGVDQPMVHLLRKLGWSMHEMPFCLFVIKPFRFLRLNGYLRRSNRHALAMDMLALSGAGSLGTRLLQIGLRGINRRRADRAHGEVVRSFGVWADDLWETSKNYYSCLAVRDREMMNTLLPESGWPGGTRLRVSISGQDIGWSVIHVKQMHNDPRFGNLTVGLITDCFAAPEAAATVLAATHRYLLTTSADLIVTNQSHQAWITGLRSLGYVILPAKRLFAMSPALAARLQPLGESMRGLHLTNLDGHGPHGFAEES